MSGRKILDSQLAEAATLREAGWTLAGLGRRYGCSPSKICWHMLRLGADPTRLAGKVLPQTRPGPIEVRRGNHVIRAFTPPEDEVLRKLALDGLGNSAIGRLLTPRRKANTVRGRLMTLARHDSRRETADG